MEPKIPFYAPRMTDRYAEAVADTIRRGCVGPGPAVAEFAERLSSWYGGAPIVLTTSGTVALQLAAYILGLRPGDTIICPAYGVASVPNAFAWMGLRVRFCDIDATGNYDLAELARMLNYASAHVVCNVNFGGNMAAAQKVEDLCVAYGTRMIDDGSCGIAHYDTTTKRRCGQFGDVGVVSFSTPKLITTGQGGAVICRDKDQATLLASAINQARPYSEFVGTNLRMTDMQAALGNAQLDEINAITSLKRSLISDYTDDRIGPHVDLMEVESGPMHYHIVKAPTRRAAELLVRELAQRGIEARQQYEVLQGSIAFGRLGRAGPLCDGAADFRARAVYLPFGLTLTTDDVERVCKAIKDSGLLDVNAAPE